MTNNLTSFTAVFPKLQILYVSDALAVYELS